MTDTAATWVPGQAGRILQSYGVSHRPVPVVDLDALAGARVRFVRLRETCSPICKPNCIRRALMRAWVFLRRHWSNPMSFTRMCRRSRA